MIIDIHTHTFPDKIAKNAVDKLQSASHTAPFTDGTNGALKASMKRAGIDYSIILPVATNPGQVVKINTRAAEQNQIGLDQNHHLSGVLSFGCMHPDFPDWHSELSRIAALGLKGIKLHPIYQNTDFDDLKYIRILNRAGELNLIVLIHAGLDVGYPGIIHASPEMICHAVRDAGPVKLILAHMGGWRDWNQVEEILPDTGVYLDTSFSLGYMTPNGDGYYQTREDLKLLDEIQFIRMIRRFGADKILFGTDSPWGDQARELQKIRALPLTKSEQDAITGGNAAKLLDLPKI